MGLMTKLLQPRALLRAGGTALLLLAALAAWDGLRWWRLEQVNRQIADTVAQTGPLLASGQSSGQASGQASGPASEPPPAAGTPAAKPATAAHVPPAGPSSAAPSPAAPARAPAALATSGAASAAPLPAEAASGPKPPPLAPELQFAQAHALAARGELDAAINRYGTLTGSTPLGLAARYNSANLLLRQALELRAANNAGQALALLELAKEGLREVLRHDPQNWSARYNLERALRLLPDPEAEEDLGNEAPKAAERSATTMRGYSPGLP